MDDRTRERVGLICRYLNAWEEGLDGSRPEAQLVDRVIELAPDAFVGGWCGGMEDLDPGLLCAIVQVAEEE